MNQLQILTAYGYAIAFLMAVVACTYFRFSHKKEKIWIVEYELNGRFATVYGSFFVTAISEGAAKSKALQYNQQLPGAIIINIKLQTK